MMEYAIDVTNEDQRLMLTHKVRELGDLRMGQYFDLSTVFHALTRAMLG